MYNGTPINLPPLRRVSSCEGGECRRWIDGDGRSADERERQKEPVFFPEQMLFFFNL